MKNNYNEWIDSEEFNVCLKADIDTFVNIGLSRYTSTEEYLKAGVNKGFYIQQTKKKLKEIFEKRRESNYKDLLKELKVKMTLDIDMKKKELKIKKIFIKDFVDDLSYEECRDVLKEDFSLGEIHENTHRFLDTPLYDVYDIIMANLLLRFLEDLNLHIKK